jgi:hypothetical protein
MEIGLIAAAVLAVAVVTLVVRGRRWDSSELREYGIEGTAKVVSVEETPELREGNPVHKILVEISGTGASDGLRELHDVIPQAAIPYLEEGTELPVYLSPWGRMKPWRTALDWDALITGRH